MSEFQASNLKKAQGGGAPDIVGKVEFTSPYFFVPPSGTTAERPQSCAPGTIRFNTDVGTLEVYKGDVVGWEYIQRRETSTIAGRGLFALGYDTSNPTNSIDFITIATTGNAKDFGDLTITKGFTAAASSKTRCVWGRSYNGSGKNTIDFVTIATQGDAIDFGDSTSTAWSPAGCGDSTRGLFGGGAPDTNFAEFITFASQGNATDFGNLHTARDMGALSNSTRGLFGGGKPNGELNIIQFVTIQSLADSVDFGDLTSVRFGATGCSSSTRGIFAAGTRFPSPFSLQGSNNIDFVTIASTGNATDFGDLSFNSYRGASCTDATRAVIVQGSDNSGVDSDNNNLCFITIASTGNAIDFGDKTTASGEMNESGSSNIHGGLSG